MTNAAAVCLLFLALPIADLNVDALQQLVHNLFSFLRYETIQTPNAPASQSIGQAEVFLGYCMNTRGEEMMTFSLTT